MNAYVTGLGASGESWSGIPILQRLSEPEVLSVFSHEMGHYVLGHVRNGIIFGATMMLADSLPGSQLFTLDRRPLGPSLGACTESRLGIAAGVLLFFFSLLSFHHHACGQRLQPPHRTSGRSIRIWKSYTALCLNASAAATSSLQILGDEDSRGTLAFAGRGLLVLHASAHRESIVFASDVRSAGSPGLVK